MKIICIIEKEILVKESSIRYFKLKSISWNLWMPLTNRSKTRQPNNFISDLNIFIVNINFKILILIFININLKIRNFKFYNGIYFTELHKKLLKKTDKILEESLVHGVNKCLLFTLKFKSQYTRMNDENKRVMNVL